MANFLYFIEGYKHSVWFWGTSEDVLPGTSSLATLDSLSCRTLAMSVPALLLLMLLAEYISNSNNKTIYSHVLIIQLWKQVSGENHKCQYVHCTGTCMSNFLKNKTHSNLQEHYSFRLSKINKFSKTKIVDVLLVLKK